MGEGCEPPCTMQGTPALTGYQGCAACPKSQLAISDKSFRQQ